VALSLSFVNQVGAANGMNQAAPGSFIPESFVRWSQDVLFDRVGYLRRRAPFTTLSLFNAAGTALDQPDVAGQRVLGVVSTRNPDNDNRIGVVVTSGSVTRILFYDSNYRKRSATVLETVMADTIMFSRPALDGGVFIGLLENYGTASSSNKNLLYYWRGGTGENNYTVNSCTLGITNNQSTTGAAKASSDKIEKTNHGYQNGYPIIFSSVGTITGLTVNTTVYYVVSAATNDFQVSTSVGGSPVNLGGSDDNVTFTVGGHATYTNRISGSFDTSKLSAGMFVYRKVSASEDRYLGVVKAWATDGSYVDLEKDCVRTFGYGAVASANTSADVKFVNVRPYVHNHGRGLITKTAHGLTVTSGTVGSDGEGHFAAADLAGTVSGTRWALYRASDGEWLGDVASVTNNAALSLDAAYHTDIVPMNADEYVARPYASITLTNDATKYTGCFNTTYAGYQWFGNGGSIGTENRIVFSAYHDPESVDLSRDAADSIVIPGTQQMRGIATSSTGILIFLDNKTYILRGNYRSNFSLEELYPEGCLSAQSIVEYGGGVFWAAKNGILFYDGATVRNLTENNLGAYYTDSIKTFDASSRRIYGFFYKDYLFMTFTGFSSAYTPIRYEPLYADTIDNSPSGFTLEEIKELDNSFSNEDFLIENNVPVYWESRQMYSSVGVSQQNTSGLWSAGTSYPKAVVTSGDATITGLTGIVVGDVGKPIIGAGIPAGATILSRTSATEIEMSVNATASSSPSSSPPSSVQILPAASTGNTWSKNLQFVWGPVNFIESMTFAIYLPTNAITAISNFDFRGFIKLDSAGGTKGYAGINAVNPDNTTGTYARLVDVDSMLNSRNDYSEVQDSELSESFGKQSSLYYKGPDFYMQTKHYPVGDPILKKWFRQVLLNLYLLDGGMRIDLVDQEDNDNINIVKKKQANWALFGEAGYTWFFWESNVLKRAASPNKPTWHTVKNLNTTWYNLTDAEFTRRKKKISWRYSSAGFRLYQMNNYRPANYQVSQRPHTVMIDSWNIGFKPMRSSRV